MKNLLWLILSTLALNSIAQATCQAPALSIADCTMADGSAFSLPMRMSCENYDFSSGNKSYLLTKIETHKKQQTRIYSFEDIRVIISLKAVRILERESFDNSPHKDKIALPVKVMKAIPGSEKMESVGTATCRPEFFL